MSCSPPRRARCPGSPPRLAALLALVALLLPLGATAQPADPTPDPALRGRIEQDLAKLATRDVSLYRGAPADSAFSPAPLRPVDSEHGLMQSIASRLTSSSPSVTGLSSSPYTAGAFALGVKDGEAGSVKTYGAGEGYIGVTQGKVLESKDFDGLVKRYGGDARGLNTLLQVLGEKKLVVDASQAVEVLAGRFPGVFTRGFREMIDAALSREAEYLVFGRTPAFKNVVKVKKADVVKDHPSPAGAVFNGDLKGLLTVRPKTQPVKAAPGQAKTPAGQTKPAPSATKAKASGDKARPRAATPKSTTRQPVRGRSAQPKRGFFGRIFGGGRK